MSEMRWVLLGGAAIVMAMLVAWTMQSDTGPMPTPRHPVVQQASVQDGVPAAPGAEGSAPGPARKLGGPVDIRATYGNPLAAQLHRGRLVPVAAPTEPPKDEAPAPAPE